MLYKARLSRETKRKKRRRMAEMVRAGKTLAQVAEHFAVSASTVFLACKEAGLPPRKRGRPKGIWSDDHAMVKVTRAQWRATDWTRRDVDIARDYGVSRERVRQVRQMLGVGESKYHR